MAWTVPRRTGKPMSVLATTPGKRLVMPSSSTARSPTAVALGRVAEAVIAHTPGLARAAAGGFSLAGGPAHRPCRGTTIGGNEGPGWHATVPPGPCLSGARSRGRGDLDLAVGGRVVDTAGLQVVDLVARELLALGGRLDEVEHADVDLLDHGRDDDVLDIGSGRQGLVGVDTDRHLARGLGGGEDATARAASGVVDHVGAALEHALGSGLALGRVGEAREVRRLGEVLALDLDAGVGCLGTGDEARLELLDERGV